jgi:hypothetical protein
LINNPTILDEKPAYEKGWQNLLVWSVHWTMRNGLNVGDSWHWFAEYTLGWHTERISPKYSAS